MRSSHRRILGVFTATAMLLGMTGVALADNVVNNVDTSVDAAREQKAVAVGGSATVKIFVVNVNNNGGDPGNSCNLSGQNTSITLDIVSADTAIATVSPTQITIDGCDPDANGPEGKTVTISGVANGTVDINITQVSATTSNGGSFNLQPAQFQAVVGTGVFTPPDSTPPVITPQVTGTLGNNGWYVSDVTVSWTVEDNESSISSSTGCGPTTISTDTAGTTLTCSATSGGGTASQSVTIKRDATDPTITFVSRTLANSNGWNNGDVTVNWSCSDSLSGAVEASIQGTVSAEGADQSATGTCTDNAGNTASDTEGEINIDKTKPTVSLVGGPADGATYYFGSVPAAPTCSAADALSGIDGSCSVSGYAATVGTHTVTASATDKAGNSNSASATYQVLAWTLNGFNQPVDMSGVYNTVKGGSTVPLKFEVFAGPTELTSTSVVKSFVQTKIACDGSAPVDDVEFSTTGGTSLRYDATAGQFIQNWQTPKLPGACYRVTMTTQDGSSLSANFKLK